MKVRYIVTILALLMLIATACSSATPAPAPTATSAPAAEAQPAATGPIKIGGAFNLTGALSSLDVPAANGAKLALKEINAAGGVLGRPVELDIFDGKTDPATVANTVTQMIESDKVAAVIGYTDSDSALAAGPIAQQAGVPFITAGATSPKLPAQIGDMMFLAPFGDNVQAAAGAEFAVDKFGKKAYLLWDKGTEYTTLLAGYFKQRFAELGGEIVLEDTYQFGDKDFSAQITKVRALSEQPDFYYISAMPDDIGTTVKQFRDAGITGPIVGGDGYDTPLLVEVAGKASDNVFFTTHALMDAEIGTDAIKKFIADYKAEYGNDPENAFAALGYDTMRLIVDAIQRAGSTDGKAIKKAIEETTGFPGITGQLNYSAQSHVPRKGVTMIEVKDGRFTLAKEIVPEKVPPAGGGVAEAPAAPSGEPIKIGGAFNLTGALSSLDVPAANGAKLALKEINAAGGVLGRPVELDIFDGKTDPATVANTVTQMIESDKVAAVIGYTDSDSALAAGPIAQQAGVPFITAGATSPKLPAQIGDMMFLAPFGDNVQAAAGAEFAVDKFGKKAYLLWDKGTEYTTLLAGYFKQRFAELGGEIVLEDTYQFGDKDFSAQITKVRALSEQPDFYYISAMPDDIGTTVKQFRDAGITGPIVGGDGYDTPLLVEVAGKASDNVFFTTHALMDAEIGTDAIKKFIADYTAEYGNPPENAFAALGYDTMRLIADAIQRAGSTDGKAIKKAIEETKGFPGISGELNYSAESHVPRKGVTMIEVKDGKFTLAKEIVPQKVPAP